MRILLISLIIFMSVAKSQNFQQVSPFQDETFIDPGNYLLPDYKKRLPFVFEDIKSVTVGDYNNDSFDEILIIAPPNQLVNSLDSLYIHTLESYGYEIIDPRNNHESAVFINTQENLDLDTTLNSINNIPARWDARTYHSVNQRYSSTQSYNFNYVKAFNGDYNNDGFDQVLMTYYDSTNKRDIIYLVQQSTQTNTLNYTLSMTEIYNDTTSNLKLDCLKYGVTGDFDNDGDDELYLLIKNDVSPFENWLYEIEWNGTSWTRVLLQTYTNTNINFNNVYGATAGDFDGDNIDEFVIAYDAFSDEIRMIDSEGSTNTTVFTNNASFNVSKIEHFISGDFNADDTTQVAIIMDYGTGSELTGTTAKQSIYITGNHYQSNWKFEESIIQHRSNMTFDNNVMTFAFTGNFDFDVLGLDDIACVYIDVYDLNEHYNGRANSTSQILTWISKAPESINDYMVDHPDWANPQILIGATGFRLASDYNRDVTNNTGFYDTEYKTKMSELYNVIFANRRDFTDFNLEFYDPADQTRYDDDDSSNMDYYNEYVQGLRRYLDSADAYDLKVVPFLGLNDAISFDHDTALSNAAGGWRVAHSYLDDISTLPNYMFDILTDDTIMNHNSLIGLWTYDEPMLMINAITSDKADNNFMARHFSQAEYNFTMDHDHLDTLTSNIYQTIKDTTDLLVFSNYQVSDDEFRFYNNRQDVIGLDFYPEGYKINAQDPSNIYIHRKKDFYHIQGYSQLLMRHTIRNNYETSYHWVQGLGYGDDGFTNDTIDNVIYPIPDMASPSNLYQRYAFFCASINGVRGHILFRNKQAYENDTTHFPFYRTLKEFNFYKPWFETKNLNNYISSNRDRDNGQKLYNDGNNNIVRALSYSFHEYDNKYLLFATHMEHYANNTRFNINKRYLDSLNGNQVYLLSQDYYANGMYEEIDYEVDGDFINFTIDFKPYEVKIIAIGELPDWDKPNEWINGELSFSNQRKIVAYPIIQESLSSPGSIDTLLRYHTVYHRYDTNRRHVYYRRSEPVNPKTDDNIISWEPEHKLSHGVEIYNVIGPDGDSNIPLNQYLDFQLTDDCAYPSLVVRFDSLGSEEPVVYVVFNCAVEDDGTITYIVENKFLANSEIQSIPTSGRTIASFRNNDLDNWGHPMINASYFGNYYVWNDQGDGAVVAYKNSNEDNFINLNDSLHIRFNNDSTSIVSHPSVNSYSRILSRRDDVGVVWEERLQNDSSIADEIYYTRVSRLNGMDTVSTKLQKYLSVDTCYDEGSFPNNRFNTDTTILWASYHWTGVDKSNPIIYRDISVFPDHDPWGNDALTHDRLFWDFYNQFKSRRMIGYHYVDFFDSLNTNDNTWYASCRRFAGPSHIQSDVSHLSNPNLSQGRMNFDEIGNHSHRCDSIYVLNFVKYDSLNAHFSNEIWQMNDNLWGYLNNWAILTDTTFERHRDDFHNDNYYNEFYANKIIGNGKLPQLAAMPHIIGKNSWSFNRRIFEIDNNGNIEVVPSLEHFAKKGINESKRYDKILIGFSNQNDGKSNSITNPILEYNGVQVKLEMSNKVDNGILVIETDTIRTNWFQLINDMNISFEIGKGNDKNKIDYYLQRMDDNKLFKISGENNLSNKLLKLTYQVTNAKETYYRFLVINKSTNVKYIQETILDNFFYLSDSSKFKRQVNEMNVRTIDLGFDDEIGLEMSLFPNPMSESFSIELFTLRNIEDVEVYVTSLTGDVVYKTNMYNERKITIDQNSLNSNDKYYYVSIRYYEPNSNNYYSVTRLLLRE